MNNFLVLLIVCFLWGCKERTSDTNVVAPGEEKSLQSNILGLGADVLQDQTPPGKLSLYLDGFHFYNGYPEGQMEAHHYVTQLNEDVHQAIIYDGNGPDAKIMGIEYIISTRLFEELPEEEKKLWHSHDYEVSSGLLVAPGIPDEIEHTLMEELISTYGKTIHTWHTDKGMELPLGAPLIMMGFTKDGQIQQDLVRKRDADLKVSTNEKRRQRADIPLPYVDPLANAWENGQIRQLHILDTVPVEHPHHPEY